MEPLNVPPPRKPGRLTWAVAGRLCGRAVIAFTLLWVVALVAWPAVWRYSGRTRAIGLEHPSDIAAALVSYRAHQGLGHVPFVVRQMPGMAYDWHIFDRDASLRVLVEALGE